MAEDATGDTTPLLQSSSVPDHLPGGRRPLSNTVPIVFVVFGLFLDYFTLTSIIPIVPSILSSSSVSPSLIFLLFSSKSLFQILANPAAGRLVDKHPDDPSRLFVPSLLLLSLSSFLFALGCSSTLLPSIVNALSSKLGGPASLMSDLGAMSGQYPLLLVARSLQGVSSSGVLTSGLTFITSLTPASHRGGSLGVAMSGIPLGVLLGPPLGGLGASLRWGGSGVFGLVGLLAATEGALFYVYFNCGESARRRKCRANYYYGGDDADAGERDKGEARGEAKTGDECESGRETIPTNNLSEPFLLRDDYALSKPPPPPSSSSSSSFSVFSRLHPLTSLTVSLVLINTCIAVTEPLCPIYLSAAPFSKTTSEVGLTFSAMSISYLIFTPLSGLLVDKLEMYTPPLYLGLMIAGLGLSLVFLTPPDPGHSHTTTSVWETTVPGLSLLGVGVALADACAAPLATLLSEWGDDRVDEDEDETGGDKAAAAAGGKSGGVGRALSGVDSAVNIGFLIGPLIAVAVGDSTGNYMFLGVAWGAGVVGLYAVIRGGSSVVWGLLRREKSDVTTATTAITREGKMYVKNCYKGGWGAEINARRRLNAAENSKRKTQGEMNPWS